MLGFLGRKKKLAPIRYKTEAWLTTNERFEFFREVAKDTGVIILVQANPGDIHRLEGGLDGEQLIKIPEGYVEIVWEGTAQAMLDFWGKIREQEISDAKD